MWHPIQHRQVLGKSRISLHYKSKYYCPMPSRQTWLRLPSAVAPPILTKHCWQENRADILLLLYHFNQVFSHGSQTALNWTLEVFCHGSRVAVNTSQGQFCIISAYLAQFGLKNEQFWCLSRLNFACEHCSRASRVTLREHLVEMVQYTVFIFQA